MSDKEKEFIKKVNIDKAKNKTFGAIGLIILSILLEIFWIHELGIFGMIGRIISLIILLIARIYMSKYNEFNSKRFVICSIAVIAIVIIYELFESVLYIEKYVEGIIRLGRLRLLVSKTVYLNIYLVILFAINKDISKAINPIKYKESTDWFYETYEEKKGENKNV